MELSLEQEGKMDLWRATGRFQHSSLCFISCVKRCHAKITFELLNNIKIKLLHLNFRIMLSAQSILLVCLPGDEEIEHLSGRATQRSAFIWLLRTPGSFGLGENSGSSA